MDQLIERLESHNIYYEKSYSYFKHNRLRVRAGLFHIHIYDCINCCNMFVPIAYIVDNDRHADYVFQYILHLYGCGKTKL